MLLKHPTEESLHATGSEADEIENVEVDIELVPLEDAQLQMTSPAAELRILFAFYSMRCLVIVLANQR